MAQPQFPPNSNDSNPIGTILLYAASKPPPGYLICDGREVSRKEYKQLYKILKEDKLPYGIGDGISTFNLPDLRGRTVIGLGHGNELTNRLLGQKDGYETHQLTKDEMPTHNHDVTDDGHSHGYYPSGSNNNTRHSVQLQTASGAIHYENTDTTKDTTGITIKNTGGNQHHNNMQPFLVLNYIIKY